MGIQHKIFLIVRNIVVAFGSIGVLLFASAGLASAQSNSLGVTPEKEYTVKPGGSVSDTLYVENLSQTSSLTVNIEVVDFSANGEGGTPALNLKTNVPLTTWSLKPYMTVPSTVTVGPTKTDYIPLNIKIPANLGAGSYYSAVLYSANPNGDKQVNIAAASATLVFVTVPGQANELLQIKQYGTFTSTFFNSKPTTLAYTLQNEGNIAEDPNGSILINNMFGKQVYVVVQANPGESLALIGQTRLFETCIDPGTKSVTAANGATVNETVCEQPHLWPGYYTAAMTLLYGINGSPTKQINATTSFWYLPLWSILTAIALVIVIILLIWIIKRKITRRRHKKPHTEKA
jgi:hypothetical protein